ncbi:MAG: hypothetical protein IJ232_08915, partial [Lachnospiraceae bacterium]|nr:hypothetical protein [Lachnospiraceae bacterium]
MRKRTAFFAIMLMFLFVLLPNNTVKAEETFEPDENGVYHITSTGDFSAFVQKTTLKKGGDYSGSLVSLDTDLTIEGSDIKGRGFKGVFEGNGHTITYKNDDMTPNSALFPFSLRGTIKNLKINVKDCVLDASKHDEGSVVGRIFSTSGGSMDELAYIENVYIYGDVKVVPDEANRKTVDCTAIDCANSKISNCIVNLAYDLDKNKIEQFLQNTQEYVLNLNLYQFGSKLTTNMVLTNSYALGGYSSSFDEIKESIQNYYNSLPEENSSSYCIIAPFGGYVGDLYPCSQDNCYSNVNTAPIYLVGQKSGLEYASL